MCVCVRVRLCACVSVRVRACVYAMGYHTHFCLECLLVSTEYAPFVQVPMCACV